MPTDFNLLEAEANAAVQEGRVEYAISIYSWMSTGDSSLDAGYLGERLGECYDMLGQAHVARYWYRRAVEENPGVRLHAEARLEQLEHLDGSEFLENAALRSSELGTVRAEKRESE